MKILKDKILGVLPKGPILLSMSLVLGLFLLVYPFVPRVKYEIERKVTPEKFTLGYYDEKYDIEDSFDTSRAKIAGELTNRLIIPKIGVDIEMFYSSNEEESLNKGAWVVPGSTYPGDNGELVITGHRFQILPPAKNTFYNLDKLETGDVFIIVYQGYAYKYEVTGSEVVKPEEFGVTGENATYDDVVLYTCTPLWTAAKRLLVHSKPVSFY